MVYLQFLSEGITRSIGIIHVNYTELKELGQWFGLRGGRDP